MRSLWVCAVAVLVATSAFAVLPPPNDDCSNATVVGALPYSDEVDTSLARPGFGDDDPLGCGPGNGPTVWYEFVPPADGYYCARTCGSDYDTVLGTRLGSCFGPDHDCNDDSCDLESVVWFDGTAGSPVLFVIGAYEFSPKAARGGYLSFSVMDASADSDGDGVYDCDDNCVETTNPMQPDADFDGLGDECETCTGFGGNGQDTDGDGICGYADRCPFVYNPAQTDADHDLSGDECDQCAGPGGVDQDLDGICDDVADNCPTVYNPDQLDSDGDFIGDACDGCPDFFGGGTTDTDGDSVPDACDVCPDDPADACATLWGCVAEQYPSTIESRLVRLNPATGMTKTVGSLGTTDCRGLAFEPGTGRLLAFARSLVDPATFDLFSVDPATAAITRIGQSANENEDGEETGGMAFRSDGRLYAAIARSMSTIDPATGTSTFLGFGGGYPGGIAFDGTGRLLLASDYYELAEIDQTTGEVAAMLPNLVEPYGCQYGVDDVLGLASIGGTLYTSFFCYPYPLLGTVDAATGIVTTIGLVPDNLRTLTSEICGNGTREGGEECDDGNTISGDCCSSTCRVEAAGSSCPDDGSPCTTEACDGAGSCVHDAAPPVGCVDGSPGRATLAIIGGPDPRLSWKWRGTIDVLGAFGNPVLNTDVTLCLADGGDALLASATAPANGVCQGGQPCWQPKGSGYAYRDLDRTPEGIEKMSLALSPQPGKAKLKVKGRGPNLGLATLPYTTPLHAWLIGDDGGGCWKASYSSTRRNDVKKLKAISD